MKKIWFLCFLFLLVFIFSSCQKKVSLQEENERLLSKTNQIIQMLNQAFLGENSYFSGEWEFYELNSNLNTELLFTGNFAFSGQEFAGDVNLNFQQSWTKIGNQIFLSLDSQIRKSNEDLYLLPKTLIFSQGAGNIQAKFIQLILDGLLGQWVKIEQMSFPFTWELKKIPLFPQCFSGTEFQSWILNSYLSQRWDNVEFFSWNIEAKNWKWFFEQTEWKVKEEIFLFSGVFDWKKITWNFKEWRGFPLDLECTTEKNQLFCSGIWGINYFQFSLLAIDIEKFRFEWQFRKGEKEQEKSEFSFQFIHTPKTWALQSLPNTYISLEKYLEDLNIGF